jgi:hypothetical protein
MSSAVIWTFLFFDEFLGKQDKYYNHQMVFSRRLIFGSLVAGAGGLLLSSTSFKAIETERVDASDLSGPIPTRSQQLSRIRGSTRENPFDLFIIGGGATGAGCALDAATRSKRLKFRPSSKVIH